MCVNAYYYFEFCVGGYELPEHRSLHQCCPVSPTSFVLSALSEGISLVRCDVTVTSGNIELGQINRKFSLFFTKINLEIPRGLQMPAYLEGARLQAHDNILYWLSPGNYQ